MDTPNFIIGIAGGSGSGKTYLTGKLTEALGPDSTAVLTADAYYRDLSHLPPAERSCINFDHPDALEADLLASQLTALATGESIESPVYEFATHTRTGRARTVLPRPFILVEGVLILALPRVVSCLDLSIFLDVPDDVRLFRRLERDQADRGRSAAQVMDQYRAQVRPMYEKFVAPGRKTADIVIKGSPDIPKLARQLAAAQHRAGRH